MTHDRIAVFRVRGATALQAFALGLGILTVALAAGLVLLFRAVRAIERIAANRARACCPYQRETELATMTETLNSHGKPYPMPTRTAMDRAEAHKRIADLLHGEAAKRQGTNTYLRVIEDEARRHARMLGRYRAHYGPNAHI